MKKKFDHLLVLGRPACGKSEFIDYLKKLPDGEREAKFHIAKFEEIDDFPWIWEKFVDDDVWESAGHRRLFSFSDQNNPGMHEEGGALFDYCMARFNIDIAKKYLSNPAFYNDKTLLIEFSRGREKAYENALPRLNKEIFEKAAIIYINVTGAESWRRNVQRYEEKQKHSILAHMVPKRTYDHYYNTDDWQGLTGGKSSGHLTLHGMKVPFVTMNNEPELPPSPEIGQRYKQALDALFSLYSSPL